MPTAASAPSWPPEATSADPFTSCAAEAIEVFGRVDVYSATKAGLDAFAESLRAETAGSGVDVVVPALAPGAYRRLAARFGEPVRSR